MRATIYHNPDCGTSRNVLALLRERGLQPEIIEYLKHPPSRERLAELIAAAGLPVREVLRRKNPLYAELGLADDKWSDDALLDCMVANPALIERPIVVTPKGVRLCRPKERALEIL